MYKLILIIIIIIFFLLNYSKSEEEIIKNLLTNIKSKYYKDKATLIKEDSVKITLNNSNLDRYTYILSSDYINVINKNIAEEIFNYMNTPISYRKHFSNVDFKRVTEIIIGRNLNKKTTKIYFTIYIKPNFSKIFAIEYDDTKCLLKKYKNITTDDYNKKNRNKFIKFDKYIQKNKKKDGSIWLINNNGVVSKHFKMDCVIKNEDYHLVSHLVNKEKWNDIVKKFNKKYISWFGFSDRSVTFYFQDKP